MPLYLSLYLYPSTATARLLPRHPRPLPPPASTALCQIMPSESYDPLSPKTGKGHSERPAQTSGVCSGTSRLSNNLSWPCTKPHRETRKHPSQAEAPRVDAIIGIHADSSSSTGHLGLRLRLRLPSLQPESLPSSLSLTADRIEQGGHVVRHLRPLTTARQFRAHDLHRKALQTKHCVTTGLVN